MTVNVWTRWLPRLVLAAIAGAVPAAATLASALADAPPHVLEIDLAASAGGALQVFYDRGAGISEAESVTVRLAPSDEPQTYRLPLPLGTYRLFRIDPNDRAGRYVITRIRVVTGSGAEAARVPLGELRLANQLTRERLDAGGLALVTTTLANDPQLTWEPGRPLLLVPDRADVRRALGPAGLAALVAWLLAALLDRLRLVSAVLTGVGDAIRRRPGTAVVTAGVVGTLAATYPLLLDRSLVSPGNGPTNILYDQPPYAFGTSDHAVENARGTDVGAMMWAILPYTMVQREAVAAGEFPLWNRYNTIGEPLWGQGQTFFMDPFHLASLAIPDPALAMDLRFIAGRAVFAIGTGLTVALVTGHGLAAVFIALVAPFVGHFTARFNHPAYFSIVYAPWILCAYAYLAQVTAARDRARAGALLALATWLQLVGSTPKEGLVALAAAQMAGMLGLLVAPGAWNAKLGRVDFAVLGVGVAILLGAPHWMIFLDTLSRSWTLYDQPSVQLATWPHLVGYVMSGAVPAQPVTGTNPLIVMTALCALAYPKRLATSGIGLGALLAIVIVAGTAFGMIPADVLIKLPLIANIHSIALSFLGATIAPMLVVAGIGVAGALDEAAAPPPVRLAIAGGLATVLIAMVPGGPLFNVASAIGLATIVGAALVLVTLPAVHVAPSASGSLALAASAVVALFVGGLHLETRVGALDALLIQPRTRADLDAPSPALRALRAHAGSDPFRVAPVDAVLFPGTQAYWRLEGIGGPDALRLTAIESLSDAAGVERTNWGWLTVQRPESLPAVAPYLDMLNVRYLVARTDQAPPGQPSLTMDGPDKVRAVERPSAWPRAFFTSGVGRHAGVAEFAARLRSASGPFASVDRQDLAAQDAVKALPQDGMSVPAAHYRLTPNTTSFRVETTGPGIAVLSEGFVETDFRARLNGQEAPYFRVNHALKGVVIPGPGVWDVEFEYRPARWAFSLLLAALGLTGLAALLAGALLNMRARGH